ncbi:Protocadherin gamma-A6 [Paragonimus heterotremus]|uniref:Protocadherin gamma-A6 n=1 Tax=Paragonimus heterotremus TaxID=100268 RepID=A0A8J4WUW0_9TREM|nr:Protocadherin gamma-A6 [Paragonimus heterotremus]
MYLCILLCSHVWSIFVANDLPLNIEVVEESPVGTLINGVAEYLNQVKLNDLKTTEDRDIRYQLLGDDSVSRLLQIHPVHGQLRVAARIDREAICDNQDLKLNQGKKHTFSKDSLFDVKSQYGVGVLTNECVYPLNILLISQPRVNDPQQFESSSTTTRIRMNLIIRDINDNAPVWPQHSTLQVSFVETPSSAMGWTSLTRPGQSPLAIQDLAAKHAKTLDRAVDLDMGVNGTVVYRLFGPGKEYFHLDDSSQDTVDFLKPNFIHGGSTVRDIGNGFSTASSTINEMTQPPLRIWPIVPLDRETEEFAGRDGFFNLTLLAHDLGVPPKTGSIVLIITVIDVNDHGPLFHNDMLYNTNSNRIPGSDGLDKPMVIYRPQNGNIRETIPVGSFIVQLNATDKDDGIHGQITYEFCPCDRNIAWNYFKIDRHSGRVVVTKRLDYDNGPRQFLFKVSDQ